MKMVHAGQGMRRLRLSLADLAVESLRGSISVLSGSGGNIVVFSSPEGKLLVDAGISVSRPKIEAALARSSPSTATCSSGCARTWRG